MNKVLGFVFLVFLLVVVSSVSFYVGNSARADEPKPTTPLFCTYRDTAIRESPTGYIIVRIPRGTQVWVNEIKAPFAYVSYFDGSKWIEGTTTAAYLGPCESINKSTTSK